MKKILIFVESFLPGFKGGGPVTSISNLVKLIDKNFDVCIVTKNHDVGETKQYENITTDKVVDYKGYKIIYLSKTNRKTISKVIEKFNPDLLYLNGLFPIATQIVMLLNKIKYHKKMIIAPRGELQENALNIKKTKKHIYLFFYKFFKLYKYTYFHTTDIIETERIKKLFGVDDIIELPNAVQVYKFNPLKKKENELKLIFVSRISKKKNLEYALKVLQDVKSKVKFDIYGPKEDIEYWSKCESLIEELPKNIEVNYKGSLEQDKIVLVMRKYHAFFFPTKSENFGHVIVEAMQVGLIPIISDQTPWIDLEYHSAGWDINLSEQRKFVTVIERLYTMDSKTFRNLSLNTIEYIKKRIDMEQLGKQYVEFFKLAIEDKLE